MENLDFNNKENKSEDVNYWFKESIDLLKIIFGVENLSNIELFHLRNITKDVVKCTREQKGHIGFSGINPVIEIPARFLQELYGIDYESAKFNRKTEEDKRGLIEYIRRLRDRAHLI